MSKGKIIITVGISGSGKSTWAHTLWATNPSQYVIVNRDKIRELLFGMTEGNISERYWGSRTDINAREKEVTKIQDTLINEALCAGKIPIVDATHLTKKYVTRFKYWNVPVEIELFRIDPQTAFDRINKRERKVSMEVLKKQYSQFTTLIKQMGQTPEDFDFTPVNLENKKKGKPGCVLVDIDGTLAHMVFRNPYDWHRVGEDEVDEPVKSLIWDLHRSQATKIIICTGRDGVCLPETEKWLKDNNIPYDGIFIRKPKDQRPDWVVKEEMWRKISQIYHIEYLVDDRLQVVRRARALGLKVFNVAYHNF
tara:strand:- start:702 stop:1628 length:927 start_codon:yes stop_codon:yes gene_type:complete